MNPPCRPLGHHLLADFHGVSGPKLQNPLAIGQLLQEAAERIGVTVLSCHMHHFGGEGGVTGVLLLAESHMSIHTWPELGFAAVDIFTCTPNPPQAAIDHLASVLCPTRLLVHHEARGAGLDTRSRPHPTAHATVDSPASLLGPSH